MKSKNIAKILGIICAISLFLSSMILISNTDDITYEIENREEMSNEEIKDLETELTTLYSITAFVALCLIGLFSWI